MKKLFIILFILTACFSLTGLAQSSVKPKDPNELASIETAMMAKKVDINKGQQAKLNAINLEYFKAILALSTTLLSVVKKDKIELLNSIKETEFKKLFSSTQWVEYEQYKKARSERANQKRIEVEEKRNKN